MKGFQSKNQMPNLIPITSAELAAGSSVYKGIFDSSASKPNTEDYFSLTQKMWSTLKNKQASKKKIYQAKRRYHIK